MSEERRKRQEKKHKEEQSTSGSGAKIAIIVVVIAAIGVGGYFLATRKRTSPYDAFAQCLTSKKVKMYGAYWCPHCQEEKESFGSAFQYVNYVECGIEGSRAEQPVCKDAGVKNFPTWQFVDGTRAEGTLTLHALSEKSGCSLP